MKTAGAAVWLVVTGQNTQESCFSAAVWTDQADPVAGPDVESHPVQDRLGAEMLPYSFNFEQDHLLQDIRQQGSGQENEMQSNVDESTEYGVRRTEKG